MNLVGKLAVKSELASENEERSEKQNNRHCEADYADGGLSLGIYRNLGSPRFAVVNLLRVVEKSESAVIDNGLNRIGELLQKALHREGY